MANAKNMANQLSTKRLRIQKASSTVFVAVAVASVIVSISLVTFNFLWNLRGYNSRVIKERTVALETLESNVENVAKLELSFRSLEEGEIDSKVVLDSLPSKYDFPALATSIDKQVEEAGLTLESFSGEDRVAEAVKSAITPEPIEIPFNLTVKGDYENTLKLLKNFEKTIRPLRVTDMKTSGTDKLLKTELQMVTYYQPGASLEIETKVVR